MTVLAIGGSLTDMLDSIFVARDGKFLCKKKNKNKKKNKKNKKNPIYAICAELNVPMDCILFAFLCSDKVALEKTFYLFFRTRRHGPGELHRE